MPASAQRARHRLSRSWGSYGRTGVGPPNALPSPIGAWRLSRPCALPHPRSFRSLLVRVGDEKRLPHEAQEAKGRARRTCPLHEKERPGSGTESHLANPSSRIGQAQRRSGTAWTLPPQSDWVTAEKLAAPVSISSPWFVPCSVAFAAASSSPADMAQLAWWQRAPRPGRFLGERFPFAENSALTVASPIDDRSGPSSPSPNAGWEHGARSMRRSLVVACSLVAVGSDST
jgi:hypothetical protein